MKLMFNFMVLIVLGLTMSLTETRGNVVYFIYEHNHQYQQVQFKFYDAVESLNPQNIMVIKYPSTKHWMKGHHLILFIRN